MKTLWRLVVTLILLAVVAACSPTFPLVQDTRTPTPPAMGALPTVPCEIKGNINDKGEKIYHVPGQTTYSQTVIDESKGEHYFCTEDEAVQAGWRKALK